MDELHITGVELLHTNEVVIGLSDGRALTFSLEKLLTLEPDLEETNEDADKFFASSN